MQDQVLEEALLGAVRSEREAVAEVLRYLREVERRKLYLTRGCSSLFAYCREKLGAPETKRLVQELSGASKREAEKKLAGLFPESPRPERAKPVSEELVELRFTVTKEEKELLEELLDRKAHTNFERSYKTLFLSLAKKEIQKLQGKPTEDAPPQCPDQVNSRYIPAALRRQIYQRDQGRCQYRGPDGKLCASTHALEIDHIHPYARGGPTSPENLRLHCSAHNRWREKLRP